MFQFKAGKKIANSAEDFKVRDGPSLICRARRLQRIEILSATDSNKRKRKIRRAIWRKRSMGADDRPKLGEIVNEVCFWTLTVWRQWGMLVAGCNQLIGGDPHQRVTTFNSERSCERTRIHGTANRRDPFS